MARDLESGEERTFAFDGYVAVAAISPDGLRIVADRAGERSGDSDLYLCDVDSGEITLLTPHEEPAEYVTPAFRGDELVWATNEGRDTLAVGGIGSRWDLTCAADPAGRSLLVVANEDGYSRLTLHPGGDVPLPGKGVVESPVFSPDGSRLAYGFSSPTQPADVYVYELDSGETQRLTTSSTAPAGLVEPKLHRFESFDGESIPVFLFTPPGDGPFPVVVMVHGGPEAQWVPSWHVNYIPLAQHLVSRGYAVAVPNVRGSTGYGKRYEHLDDIALRLDSVRDLPLSVVHRVAVHRPGAGEDQGGEGRLVSVACHHHGLARLRDGHQGDVDVQAAAVRREQRLIGPDRIGKELHRGRLDLPRLVAVVDSVVHPGVGAEGLLARPPRGIRRHLSGPRSMSRDSERERIPSMEVLDRLSDRCRIRLCPDRTLLLLPLRLLLVLLAELVDLLGLHAERLPGRA